MTVMTPDLDLIVDAALPALSYSKDGNKDSISLGFSLGLSIP